MRTWTTILILGLFAACSLSTEKKQTGSVSRQVNHFENVSKVEVFGDSLRIEHEIYDNKIIQHWIDLKGKEDDGFDNSFTVTSTWFTRETALLDCNSELQIIWDSLDFRFCVMDVIEHYNNLIAEAGPWKGKTSDSSNYFNQKIIRLQELKSEMEKIKNKNIGSLKSTPFYLPFDLLTNLKFSLTDLRTNDRLSRVLVENYETEFSGGKNFYLVNSANDTISKIHKNEYMR